MTKKNRPPSYLLRFAVDWVESYDDSEHIDPTEIARLADWLRHHAKVAEADETLAANEDHIAAMAAEHGVSKRTIRSKMRRILLAD